MKLLAEISDETIGIGGPEKLLGNYQLRKSARTILLNEQGQMAIQHLTNHKFYKLPGGGVDAGETMEEALCREVVEEVGCACIITHQLGIVIEYRDKYNLLHISYGFVALVQGAINAPQFEAAEIAAGQTNIWVTPEAALELIKNAKPDKYESKFIVPREIAFLEEYLRTK